MGRALARLHCLLSACALYDVARTLCEMFRMIHVMNAGWTLRQEMQGGMTQAISVAVLLEYGNPKIRLLLFNRMSKLVWLYRYR